MKLCIVTGGSGGHIYPALTFADYLTSESESSVFFIGNEDRMESTIIPEAGYSFHAIHNKGLQGSILDKFSAVFGQFQAISEARKLLKKLKPDLVFAFGGYVTLPVVLAANSLKIPIVLHEQNAFVGKANKMAARYAKAIITCYDNAFKGYSNVYKYGNPRGAIDIKNIDSASELNRLNVSNNDRIVLFVMGSQGATTMNKIYTEMIPHFDSANYKVVIVTGKNEFTDFMDMVSDITIPDSVIIVPYVDQKALLPHTDLVVSRSGATTISELAAFGVASVLIPSPYVANNHQYYNAKALEEKNACILIEEGNVNATILFSTVDSLMHEPDTLKSLGNAVKVFADSDTNLKILELIESLARV